MPTSLSQTMPMRGKPWHRCNVDFFAECDFQMRNAKLSPLSTDRQKRLLVSLLAA
jgi:hypothetical protein